MKRQIIDTIERYSTIIIHRHVRPDPDAFGSQVGLKKLIEANYPGKTVHAAGSDDGQLAFLASQDAVTDDMYSGALVIVTDTANTDRIDGQDYGKGDFLVKIDHHPNVDPYGDVLWVDTDASSCSEMIFGLYAEGREYKGWTMPDEAARLLFAGIVGDTGRFMYPSATGTTFEVASELIKHDFDRQQIFAGMYEVERSMLNLQGYVYQNFQMDENGAAYIKLPTDILQQFGVRPEETSSLVSSLGDVKGICAWLIFVEEPDQIRVRLRSKKVVINELAADYGGGGHPLAAGASVHSWDEADEVISRLKAMCAQHK
ncbi:bifunctional oligoribonuclease and PAP phosphatase NrnA [Sporosarcina sp. NCCP-2716]|uniref:DHH family phosphoesterase n=1 Tax=Sporosarcina sp. NCCP-2716 TaxID=2943679 RepID=UPI0020425592|nr:bifunctional oligoribonuclease/PAP phosphatase NrnA [Sporosarcina sp. NCCP-2716]GKV69575.1 bifunctional oligoribonuclease and PAP phosphatase NrnA [Sporosarcina sp. NCCP-2716]